MAIVSSAGLLVVLLAVACGSPTDVVSSRHLGEVQDQPLQEEARKIGGGSSKLSSLQTFSNEAYSKYPDLFSTKKGDGKEKKPPRVIVLQNGDRPKGVNRNGDQEKIYINNKPVNVEYVNKNSLPEGHPLRKAVNKQKVNDVDFTVLLQSLFEIVQDILGIITYVEAPNALEKSDNGDVISGVDNGRWELTKKVFLKYLRLLETSDVFAEFREIIPVTELETALEEGNQINLVQVFIKSITPGLFTYFLGLVEQIASHFMYLGNNIGNAELREYIPTRMDLTWPVRFFAQQTLGWIGNYFSRRELVNYWEQFRSLSPFAAPGLEYIFPEEEETSMNSLMTTDLSRQEGKTMLDSAMGHPFLLMAGVGSTVLASVYAYRAIRPDFTEGNRIKRDAVEEIPSYPWNSMAFSDLHKIISAVETNPYVDAVDDDEVIPAVKPKKNYTKKYNSFKELKRGGSE